LPSQGGPARQLVDKAGKDWICICRLTDQRPMRFSEVGEVAAVFVFFKLLVLCVGCLTDKQGMRFSELQEVIEDFFFFVFVFLPIRRVWVLRVCRSYRGILFL
jgi:hypothetical protein